MDDFTFPYLIDSRLFEGRAEKLMAGGAPQDAPLEVRELDAVLSALRLPGRLHELAGEARAVAAFAVFSAAKQARETEVAKEKTMSKEKTLAKEKACVGEKDNVRALPAHFGPKVAAATAVALLAFTGVAAAAVTGSLPAPLQSFVHARIGAIAGPATAQPHTVNIPTDAARPPADLPSPSGRGAIPRAPAVPAVGPIAAADSRAGLCRALNETKTKSSNGDNGTAAHSLEASAAAAGQTVDQYCSLAPSGGKPSSKADDKTPAPKPPASQHGHGSETGSGNGNGDRDISGNGKR